MQVVDLFDVVVVEVKENQVGQAHKVLDSRDQVVLKVEQAQAFLSLEKGHMRQLSLI